MARETSKTGALTIGLVMVVAVFGCGPTRVVTCCRV